MRDLLSRKAPLIKVIAHVRALDRVIQTCQAYGVWETAWLSRLSCVTGNLGESQLGLQQDVWQRLAEEVSVVIHNGALVHWVYPYSNLKPANVQGTLDILALCAAGGPKQLTFVSSTSVLDTPYYVQLSAKSIESGGDGVSEEDDLSGSVTGLGYGYGNPNGCQNI